MVVPLAARLVAAVVGGLLVLAAWTSVTGTLIVSRSVGSWLTRWVDRIVTGAFGLAAVSITDYRRRDRLLATQPAAIVFLAAATGLVIVTLQIAYLPTLYSAFNRRETEVALLNARAGVPSWGPELLARTHYALGTGVSTLDTMPDLYARWERWAADIAESHTTYLPLVRFRSPLPLSSWVTALLAVLDSAALFLALSPGSAPVVPARLCLRGGFQAFNRIARAMGIQVPDEHGPQAGISLSYQEFLDAVARMREVGFPINYEQAAYAVAAAVDAVPALWSGPRRHPTTAIPPIRPPLGRPPA